MRQVNTVIQAGKNNGMIKMKQEKWKEKFGFKMYEERTKQEFRNKHKVMKKGKGRNRYPLKILNQDEQDLCYHYWY